MFGTSSRLDEDSTLDLDLLANDSDADGDPIEVLASSLPATSALGAALTLNIDGTVNYDPTGAEALQALADGEIGTDTFTYQVTDGSLNSNFATVTAEVAGVNVDPDAVDDAFATDEDPPFAGNACRP